MDLLTATAAGTGALAVLLFTGVVAPLVGLLLRRVSGGWEEIGKGPLSIEERRPADAEEDPDLVAAEARQLRDLIGSDS